MEVLSSKIVRPVMPNDEAFDYLATQAIADYLANECHLDGVIFPSIQTGHAASNVVLLHHAARVEEDSLPNGSHVRVSLEEFDDEGTRPDYSVYEMVPQAVKITPKRTPRLLAFDTDTLMDPSRYDIRSPSLRIDTANIEVHHIKAVSFSTNKYTVRRHRLEQTENPAF
jgi:hypothetical protein